MYITFSSCLYFLAFFNTPSLQKSHLNKGFRLIQITDFSPTKMIFGDLKIDKIIFQKGVYGTKVRHIPHHKV